MHCNEHISLCTNSVFEMSDRFSSGKFHGAVSSWFSCLLALLYELVGQASSTEVPLGFATWAKGYEETHRREEKSSC